MYEETEELIKAQTAIIEEDDTDADYVSYDINSYPAFYTLENYVKYFDKSDGTFVVPDFQRRPVWDDSRKSKLIESFLRGLPVPPVFLFTTTGSSFSIIDGLQRINTIYSFVHNEFKLKKLSQTSPYNMKRFSELSNEDQKKLLNVVLQATIIRPNSTKDKSIVYQIFERLNTGGVSLNNMEVRRSIAHGRFLEVLESTNQDVHWQNVLGVRGLGKRFLDLELVLRCFAFFEEEYTGIMKPYLNVYMEKNKNEEKSEVQRRFLEAVAQIDTCLPSKPFVTGEHSSMPNYTLLDSVIVALMHNGPVVDLAQKFEALKSNEEYMDIVLRGNGTTAKKFVDRRIQIATEFLQ